MAERKSFHATGKGGRERLKIAPASVGCESSGAPYYKRPGGGGGEKTFIIEQIVHGCVWPTAAWRDVYPA